MFVVSHTKDRTGSRGAELIARSSHSRYNFYNLCAIAPFWPVSGPARKHGANDTIPAMLHAIIFITGGAILALELLASRIMTPYFGVSLYIWSGILSITLIALAFGYWLGGRMASGSGDKIPSSERLSQWFLLMPAIASIAVLIACLVYPYVFPQLARDDLVLGAFAACAILLPVPLVATSAMNPLLVAIRRDAEAPKADAGTGRVFFVSTLGSVAGVFLTAFVLIPNFSNSTSLLIISVALALLTLVGLLAFPRGKRMHKSVLIAGAAALLGSAAMLWQANAYADRMWPVEYGGVRWTLEARANSLFGTVNVIRSEPVGPKGEFFRWYLQDGLLQNQTYSVGMSTSMYTYALELFARSYRPGLRTALVLGLGAGVVPIRLAQQGVAVDVVDINPASLEIAQRFFGFEPKRVKVHVADARTFLRRCNVTYDVIVVDLFQGDGIPEYIVTQEFFRDLRSCLAGKGVAVFNTLADLEHPLAYAHFLATLRTELPSAMIYRVDDKTKIVVNSFVVASPRQLADPVVVNIENTPVEIANHLADLLRNPRPLDETLLRGGRVITDEFNPVSADLAQSLMQQRRLLVREMPAAFLLN